MAKPLNEVKVVYGRHGKCNPSSPPRIPPPPNSSKYRVVNQPNPKRIPAFFDVSHAFFSSLHQLVLLNTRGLE